MEELIVKRPIHPTVPDAAAGWAVSPGAFRQGGARADADGTASGARGFLRVRGYREDR